LAVTLSFNKTTYASTSPTIAKGKNFKVTLKEFEKSYQQNLLFVTDKIVTKRKVLQDLINRKLGILKAKNEKLQRNPIVKEKMEDILYHAQISRDLEPKLKKITINDADVKNYYEKHKEYRTAHILFRMRAKFDSKEANAALGQAMKIYNTLKKHPNKFPELANKFSQSNVAPNGGDIGFQPAIKMAPEYFNAIKNKNNNYISPPVRTQFGYHIIKVLAVKNYADINVPLYKKIVYDKKRDSVLNFYFSKLRTVAAIKIVEKYLK